MKWITRQNAAVDRIACPWLILRFVDSEAEFLFVPESEVASRAAATGAIPFDVQGARLGHVDGRCSFESILLEYNLACDAALNKVADIVHGADIPADLDRAPEAAGLRAIAAGFRLIHAADDHRKLELELPLYDALYRWAREAPPASRPRPGGTP